MVAWDRIGTCFIIAYRYAVKMRSVPSLSNEVSLSFAGPVGQVKAFLDPIGAGLRALCVEDIDLVQSYPRGSEAPFFSGRTLAPWPNRLEDGAWELDGRLLSVPVTEPDRNNALHGLLRDRSYEATKTSESSATFSTKLSPTQGYPFTLEIAITYELGASGITVKHEARNVSNSAAPFAAGAHPFIKCGHNPLPSLSLTSQVLSYLEVNERLLPTAERDISGGDCDIRFPRVLSSLSLDTAFRVSTHAPAVLRAPDGSRTELWQDASWGWLQIFLTPDYPSPDGPVWALALEPMTAPPNALKTGEDLIWLEPGQTWQGMWGISYCGSS